MKLIKSTLPLIVWFALIGAGFFALFLYENKPGVKMPQDAPLHWPAAAGIPLTDAPYTLVMAVHPHCPCTRASLTELERILAHSSGRLKGYFLFIQPSGLPDDWVKTPNFDLASRFQDIEAVRDPRREQAHLFHLAISGQVLVYDKKGNLQFNGGITSSRGHEGDNRGANAIKELLLTGKIPYRETSIFGCALFDKSRIYAA